MSKFLKDTRVAKIFEKLNIHQDTTEFGVTVADSVPDPLTGKERVYVKWDHNSYYNPNPQEVFADELILETVAQDELSKLEEEFRAFEVQINAKVEAAAALINEANDLAVQSGQSGLYDMWESYRPLYAAMDNAGWNTSGFSC